MSVYIAYRDLAKYNFQMTLCGGPPVNPDFRFVSVKKDIYLLIFDRENYAVTKERAEQFIDEVLSKTTGSHDGLFPRDDEHNGKKTAAVIEINEDNKTTWYDFDDELMLKMLTELKDELGEPLDQRGLTNHCCPNPALPEDFELQKIYHQIYCGPDNTSPAVIRIKFPDTVTSRFWTFGNDHYVVIREGNDENKYRVPDSLIPDIKERVKELCKDPAEAYVEPGKWESYVEFGETKERICTDPDKTLELLNYIASKSEFISTSQIDTNKYYPFDSPPGNIFGMMGGMNNAMFQQPAEEKHESWPCPVCGAVNTGKFCKDCGSPGPDC